MVYVKVWRKVPICEADVITTKLELILPVEGTGVALCIVGVPDDAISVVSFISR
jgi:hypothetical protein